MNFLPATNLGQSFVECVPIDSPTVAGAQCIGGISRWVQVVTDERANNPNLIVLNV